MQPNDSLYNQKPEEPAPAVTSLSNSNTAHCPSFPSRFEYAENIPSAESGSGSAQVFSHVAPPKSSDFFADFGMESGFQKKSSSTSAKVEVKLYLKDFLDKIIRIFH